MKVKYTVHCTVSPLNIRHFAKLQNKKKFTDDFICLRAFNYTKLLKEKTTFFTYRYRITMINGAMVLNRLISSTKQGRLSSFNSNIVKYVEKLTFDLKITYISW
jgi:hypothetical protein